MDKKYREFLDYLDIRNQNKERSKEIDVEIDEKFGRECAVMITDSQRFTSRTKKYGIVQYLAVLRETYLSLNEVIAEHNGTVVKEWADDIFAVFDTPDDALTCGLALSTTSSIASDPASVR